MTDEQKLKEKLRRINALHARPTTDGERAAAAYARERIRERLRKIERDARDAPIEQTFKLPDIWSHRLMGALLRNYGIRYYRYRGQRHTTIMAKVSRKFAEETLWPEYNRIHEQLVARLDRDTSIVIQDFVDVFP
jgi:hypothetical protein